MFEEEGRRRKKKEEVRGERSEGEKNVKKERKKK